MGYWVLGKRSEMADGASWLDREMVDYGPRWARHVVLTFIVVGVILIATDRIWLGGMIAFIAIACHLVFDQRMHNARWREAKARLLREAPQMMQVEREAALVEIGRRFGKYGPGMRDLRERIAAMSVESTTPRKPGPPGED